MQDVFCLLIPAANETVSKEPTGLFFRLPQSFRIFNTWLGDPSRMTVLESILGQMRKHNLLELVKETGAVLLGGLKELEVRRRR